MPRFLAIDWEQQQLHIVQATTGRGSMRVEHALSWSLPEPLTAVAGEALGKKLRESLKEAGVASASVLACVGRERVILKELRYPAVPAHEEPAIVRFQAAKELTEALDDMIIDYTPMGNGLSAGERHALAVIVRKEVVNSLQGLCRGLGMKLLAVTPRPAAVIGALDRSRPGQVPDGAAEALLAIGPRWADLAILRGKTLLFARSLGVGATLAGEIKRSLTVFNAGADTPVQTLFVSSDGDESALCTRLGELLAIPVHLLDAFLASDAVQVDKARRGRFTAAIGLLKRWSDRPELGINFVSPKEPRAPENPRKRQKVLAAVIGLVLAVFLFAFGNMVLADKRSKIQEKNAQKTELENQLKSMTQKSLDITALKDWDNNTVSWLDELYDLTARFPHQRGFRINSMTANPSTKKNVKDKFAASVTLQGVAPAADNTLVHKLVEEINKARAPSNGPMLVLERGMEVQWRIDVPEDQEIEIKAGQWTMGNDGVLLLGPNGSFRVGGLNLAAATAVIEKKLATTLKTPKLRLSVLVPYLRATIEYSKQGANAQEFGVKVDLARQAPEQYTTILKVPPPLRPASAPPPMVEEDAAIDEEGGKQ